MRDFIHWVVADGGVAGVLPPGLADMGWRPRMASSGAAIPVLVAGFAAQDKLVQGLSLGAIK